MRNLALLVARCASCVALLAGCATATRNLPPAAVYDFGPPVARLPGVTGWPSLALAVRSPPWFDSLNVDYRLAYNDPRNLREYAGSRWAGAPGVLLAQRLTQLLGTASGDGSAGGSAVCLLRVDLNEFAQRFDTPQRSYGTLYATVGVYDARRRLLGQRRFSIEQPAASADAHGGVAALGAASSEFGRQIASWLDALEGDEPALRHCRQRDSAAG